MANSPMIWGPNGAINLQQAPGIYGQDGSVIANDGVKNYLRNATFANGNGTSVGTNFSLFTTTLTNGLPSGSISAGAASLTFGTTSSNPLRVSESTNNLSVAASTTWTAGQGLISTPFTVDREDLGKVLTFSMSYECTNGPLNANWSGVLGSQSIILAVYDVTASAWLPSPPGALGMNQNSGAGKVVCTFQTSVVSGQQYQVAILASQTTTGGGFGMSFNSLQASQQTINQGTPQTDAISYTPTFAGLGTPTSVQFSYQRSGKYLLGSYYFVSGTNTATTASFSLPPGLSIDTSVLPNITQVGEGGTTATPFAHNVITNAPTPSVLYPSPATATYMNGVPGTTWANTTTFSGTFRVPISGWSSQVQMSNDTDTRVISMGAYSQIPTGTITSSFNVVKFGTVNFDSSASYSTSTGLYTVPVTGKYQIFGNVEILATYSGVGQQTTIKIYKNGTSGVGVSLGGYNSTNTMTTTQPIPFTAEVDCTAGDTLGIYSLTQGSSASFNNAVTASSLFINRVSGPSVIAPSESVNASYQNNAGTTLAASTFTAIPWGTKLFDSHTAMNTSTGVYSVPVSGKYRVSSILITAASTVFAAAPGNVFTSVLYKNGVNQGNISWTVGIGTFQFGTQGSVTISCNAGDALAVYSFQNSASPISLSTTSGNCQVFIERIGN